MNTVPARSVSTFVQSCPAKRIHWLYSYETPPQRGEIPPLASKCGGAASMEMRLVHQIFCTNPHDMTLFCSSSRCHSFDSVSPYLLHMLSVIKISSSLQGLCGGGCIGIEKLGSVACAAPGCWHMCVWLEFMHPHLTVVILPPPPRHTHTESQNPPRSFQPN